MKRLSSILMLVLAIVALSGPSFGMGFGLHGVPQHGHSVTSKDGHAAFVWKCKELGGKRVMPCHPDIGVLVPALASTPPSLSARSVVRIVPLARGQSPTAELPPPRLG